MTQKEAGITEKLYEADGYLWEFEAVVLSCQRRQDGSFGIELDRTAFFPRGGGQESDRGTLGERTVTQVISDGARIYHVTDGDLPVGKRVCGYVDGKVRFPRMQNHSGEHVLSGLVWREKGFNNVGFHLGDGYVTLDFDGVLTPEELRALELRANEIVWENRPITARYPDATELAHLTYRSKLELTENVRIVTVEGVDTCACCAPHCRRTGEIGLLKVTDAIHYKGGMRLWIACGAWALADYAVKQENVLTVSRLFSVKPPEAAEAVEKSQRELLAAKGEIGALKARLADAVLAAALPDKEGNILFFLPDLDGKTQRNLAVGGAAKCTGVCGVFSPEGETYRFVCASERVPMKALGAALLQAGGKGGGNDTAIQGTVNADENTLRHFFATYPQN